MIAHERRARRQIYLSRQMSFRRNQRQADCNDDSSNEDDKALGQRLVSVPGGTAAHRRKLKRIVLLFGYLGTRYQGLQINKNAVTIEGTLIDALKRCDVIGSYVPTDNPQIVQFTRCARTDKGVHAAGQVVSFMANITDDMINKLNAHLPDDIRAFGYRHVPRSFHCKNACNARTYEFVIPTFAFHTPTPLSNDDPLFQSYRVPASVLTRYRALMKQYEGTHNFHNFTIGKPYTDPRYVRSFCGISG
jgi:tRNA pseudouridine38-40 synthase